MKVAGRERPRAVWSVRTTHPEQAHGRGGRHSAGARAGGRAGRGGAARAGSPMGCGAGDAAPDTSRCIGWCTLCGRIVTYLVAVKKYKARRVLTICKAGSETDLNPEDTIASEVCHVAVLVCASGTWCSKPCPGGQGCASCSLGGSGRSHTAPASGFFSFTPPVTENGVSLSCTQGSGLSHGRSRSPEAAVLPHLRGPLSTTFA